MRQSCEHRNGRAAAANCIALIAVGANLPGSDGSPALETCRRAVAMLDQVPNMRLIGLSRWYLTAPVPVSGQPDYVNAVAALRVEPGHTIDPAVLLTHLMEIEARCGRQRGVPNAARTMDLDIVAIGATIRSVPDPILPHPRAHLRAFVLTPLADVAPNWVHPVLGRTAGELLADLPDQDIRLL